MIDKMMKKGVDIENVGIMQGFMDSMADDMEDEGDDEDPEKMMERRPDSPEILMNNLRGDMRSIDARRDELADLVGYQAATETPETVLAMLQPILATQGGGIGALPQSADMAQGPQPPMMGGAPGMPPAGMPPLPPDAGMPPPGMPPLPPDAGMGMAPPPPPGQGGIAELMGGMGGGGAMPGAGMPPSDQPPIAMAQGGFVQNFQVGSDELGVRPSVEELLAENDTVQYPPDMVAAAKEASMNLFRQQPTTLPTLESSMQTRLPQYSKILGPNKGESEAQLLFDLGQRAFNFASNTDDAGRPLRGGFASRLAGAVKTLPASMGKRLDEINKIDRQIKMLSLQQGEKDIDQIVAQNAKLQDRKSNLMNVILKEEGRRQAKLAGDKDKNPFGSSVEGGALYIMNTLGPKRANNTITEAENVLLDTAVTAYTQETINETTEPLSGIKTKEIRQNKLPPVMGGPANTSASVSNRTVTTTADGNRAPSPPMFLGQDPKLLDPKTRAAVDSAPKATFFNLSATGTGFVPVIVAGVAKYVPLEVAGSISPEYQQDTTALTNMSRQIVTFLQNSPNFADKERQQILKDLSLDPRLLQNRPNYINQLVGLDKVFRLKQEQAEQQAEVKNIGIAARNKEYAKVGEYRYIRTMLGVQDRKIDTQEQWMASPPGEYLVFNPNKKTYEFAIKP